MSDNVAHALSGAGGGIISIILTYPLLSVSSRLQVQRAGPSCKVEYKNTADAFLKILAKEGPKGLYAGLGSGVFGIAITNGVYYYYYEAVKAIFVQVKPTKGQPMSTVESMISGAIAGSAVVLATHPIWTVNTRLTVRKGTQGEKEPSSALSMAANILKHEGMGGLYAGVGAALMLVMNPIIQYAVFEQAKAKIAKLRVLKSFDYFLLGAVSKLVATSITYPYIVVKSRMQISQNGNDKYASMVDGFKKIMATEGWVGFYGGLQSKILQSVLTAAFLFMTKEALFDWAIWLLVIAGARKRVAGNV